MGAKVHYTTVNPQRVNDHRKKMRAEAEEKLDEYVKMCIRKKVLFPTYLAMNKTNEPPKPPSNTGEYSECIYALNDKLLPHYLHRSAARN